MPTTSYKIADVARMLQCSRARVESLIASGQLRAFVIPASGPYAAAVRVDAASLDELMSGQPIVIEVRQPPKRKLIQQRSAAAEKWFPRKTTH